MGFSFLQMRHTRLSGIVFIDGDLIRCLVEPPKLTLEEVFLYLVDSLIIPRNTLPFVHTLPDPTPARFRHRGIVRLLVSIWAAHIHAVFLLAIRLLHLLGGDLVNPHHQRPVLPKSAGY